MNLETTLKYVELVLQKGDFVKSVFVGLVWFGLFVCLPVCLFS